MGKGEPYGTFSNTGAPVNPEFDVTGDCSDKCFVTDNGVGSYSSNDVDNGNTILTSPVFDATIYLDPSVEYYRWFTNFGGSSTPNDSMQVKLSNGTTTVTIENIDNTNGSPVWTQSSFLISAYIQPTSNMQLIVEIADNSPGHIVEGAIDQFQLTGALATSIPNQVESGNSVQVFPNPFSNRINIQYHLKKENSNAVLHVWNAMGQEIISKPLSGNSGLIQTGEHLTSGIYFLAIEEDGSISERTRLIKQ